jgi:hypothetical protein
MAVAKVEFGVTTCTRTKVTKEIRVEIEPSYDVAGYARDEYRRVQLLEAWATGLKEFFNDHRSMDVNSIQVVKETEDVCSVCKEAWDTCQFEPDFDSGESFEPYDGCANCGAKVT